MGLPTTEFYPTVVICLLLVLILNRLDYIYLYMAFLSWSANSFCSCCFFTSYSVWTLEGFFFIKFSLSTLLISLKFSRILSFYFSVGDWSMLFRLLFEPIMELMPLIVSKVPSIFLPVTIAPPTNTLFYLLVMSIVAYTFSAVLLLNKGFR